MNLFGKLSAWTGRSAKMPPIAPKNTFREVAVTYDGPTAQVLPTVRRLIELQMSAQLTLAYQGCPPTENTTAYNLLVINVLVPAEAGQMVITADKHEQLVSYLRTQIYHLARDRQSPFWDMPAENLYAALILVLHTVENYTHVKPFWPCQM